MASLGFSLNVIGTFLFSSIVVLSVFKGHILVKVLWYWIFKIFQQYIFMAKNAIDRIILCRQQILDDVFSKKKLSQF